MTVREQGGGESTGPGAVTRSRRTRSTYAGALLWLLSIQFFVAELVVAAAWRDPSYSYRRNAISDLGAVNCGEFDGRAVCSPLAPLMNASLVVLGLCMCVGAVLLCRGLGRGRVGFSMVGIAGVGALLVGVFPEDTTYRAHVVGQDLAFLIGNAALIVVGFGRWLPTWLRWFSVASGSLALIALGLFLTHHRFWLDLGGMERLVAYPLLIWLMVFGAWALRTPRDPAM